MFPQERRGTTDRRRSHFSVRRIGCIDEAHALAATACQDVLGQGLDGSQRAMLQPALSFFTWRTLVREAGLQPSKAVSIMVGAIQGAT
ncbi:hypothetical protein CK222_05980 [Mesorhizobium sp. WSM3866]|uniref:hypothetical protein n=1 Tax=Mesorhizobium sp. WSM3866 TaxID=422271 RepID=UPI000BB06503|nr:hypothetical protein [Mesorhizobium sp. WSM3866]PBB44537.1 hypothetical protein CK222_05980 [Mesorhizobium sp. WSM3866]